MECLLLHQLKTRVQRQDLHAYITKVLAIYIYTVSLINQGLTMVVQRIITLIEDKCCDFFI